MTQQVVLNRAPSRRRIQALVAAGALVGAAAFLTTLGAAPVHAEGTTTTTFSAPGEHLFTVPAGVTSIDVLAIGASGAPGTTGGGAGGDGAKVTATVSVTPGELLYAEVAVGGGVGAKTTIGGIPVAGGDGGGESDLRTCTAEACPLTAPGLTVEPRILVAGGGGGGAPGAVGLSFGPRGQAGAPAVEIQVQSSGGAGGFPPATACETDGYVGMGGVAAVDTGVGADQGEGGNCSTGGAGGSAGGSGSGKDGKPGVAGGGGDGGNDADQGFASLGGGGGAGLFGGGGGAAALSEGLGPNGAGGGGSSCAPCVRVAAPTAARTGARAELASWTTGRAANRTADAVQHTVTNAAIAAATGAAAVVTITYVLPVVATPTPTATAIPTPTTGTPIATSLPWPAGLAAAGVVLVGLAIAARRRPGDTP